jgi:hypothetical protein
MTTAHTPGPLEFLEAGRTEEGFNRGQPLTITEVGGARNDVANLYSADDATVSITREEAIGNARLLAAAYNAFDSAARALNVNAVELAERMHDGGLAELIKCLEQMTEFYVDDYSDRDISKPVKRARAILAETKGGAYDGTIVE